MLLYMLFNPIDLHMFQFVLCIYIHRVNYSDDIL